MKQFNENLAAYQRRTGFTDKELLDKAKLTQVELDLLKSAQSCADVQSILVQLALNLKLDYSSLCSESGFKIASVLDQYLRCPRSFQSYITSAFFNAIDKKYGRDRIVDANIVSDNQFTRRANGGSVLTGEIFNKMCKQFPYLELSDLLGSIMFKRIPNYNYRLSKTVHKFKVCDVAAAIGITNPTYPGRWTCISCRAVNTEHLIDLAEFCTHRKDAEIADKFITEVLSEDYFKRLDKEIESNGDIEFVDPPKDFVQKFIDDVLADPCEHEEQETSCKLEIDESLVLKMFSKLPDSDKNEVMRLILTKFEASL